MKQVPEELTEKEMKSLVAEIKELKADADEGVEEFKKELEEEEDDEEGVFVDDELEDEMEDE